MKSELELNEIKVSESIFQLNDTIEFSKWKEENEVSMAINAELGIAEVSPANGRLTLTIAIGNKNYRDEKLPFYLELTMFFFFQDSGYKEGESIGDKYYPNMVAIAYPYLRSQITNITALSGIESVIIPAINVYDLLEDIHGSNN